MLYLPPSYIRPLNLIASLISIIVLLVVVFMRQIHIETTIDFRFLPKFYSSLNLICAIVLILAFLQVRKGNLIRHKQLMITAMLISLVFLISYVIYHVTCEEVKFCKTGNIRILYFILLISHVILSALCFPFILFTFVRGITGQVERHKKLAKIIYPLWLYICISGPLCYILLYPCIDK